jgi:integrase
MGMPVNTVQRRAGHAMASTTINTYGHAMAGTQLEAAEKIEDWITPVAVNVQSKPKSSG